IQGRLLQPQRRQDSGGRNRLSGRAISGAAELDGEGLSQPHPLQRGRQGRPLRRVGATSNSRGGGARGLQVAAHVVACWQSGHSGCPLFSTWIKPMMKAIKTYWTRVDADLATIALDSAGVPSVVVGFGVAVKSKDYIFHSYQTGVVGFESGRPSALSTR